MKLRNKKTGEIIEDAQYRNYSTADGFGIRTSTDEYFYKSLKEFFEYWEDYTYREPLIKDDKVRRAVKAWADFNRAYPIYCEDKCTLSYDHAPRIEFKDRVFANLDDRPYTISELCGDEE